MNCKLNMFFQVSLITEYSVVSTTETNSDNVISSEIFDTSKYCVYRCKRFFINTHLSRCDGVCLAIDSILSPINFNLKKSIHLQQLFSIDIVGAKIQ